MSARALMIPSWTETIAALRETEGVRVFQKCSTCQAEGLVDLDAMIAEFGPLYSLWNREPPCPSGCGGRLWYRAQPAAYFHRILKDAPDYLVEDIHQRWKASLPADVRDTLPLFPMLQAAGLCVAVACAQCELRAFLSPGDVRAWGDRISTLDLEARIRCKERCGVALDLVASPATTG